MRKLSRLLLLICTLITSSILSQKTCMKHEENFEDMNAITKCSVDDSKKAKDQINVDLSAKKRYSRRNKEQNRRNLNALKRKLSRKEVRRAYKFKTVDNIPTFKKCKNFRKNKRLKCFNKNMIKHIKRHFFYPNEAIVKKIEGEVWIRFIIDKNGRVSNIKAKGSRRGKVLVEEAERIISNLPRLVPGTKNGKKVPVVYGLPINFILE